MTNPEGSANSLEPKETHWPHHESNGASQTEKLGHTMPRQRITALSTPLVKGNGVAIMHLKLSQCSF